MVQAEGAFQAVERPKLYASVVEQILDSIRSGLFPPGSALPAERTLASQSQVSRGSLRGALRVLEHARVLDIRTVSGMYVATEGGSSATFLRAQAAALGEHSPLDVIVARAAIGPVCAEQAALSHHPTGLAALEVAFAEQARADEDVAESDLASHPAVAAASRNSVLLALESSGTGTPRRQRFDPRDGGRGGRRAPGGLREGVRERTRPCPRECPHGGRASVTAPLGAPGCVRRVPARSGRSRWARDRRWRCGSCRA